MKALAALTAPNNLIQRVFDCVLILLHKPLVAVELDAKFTV
jgi:hypothetical protein